MEPLGRGKVKLRPFWAWQAPSKIAECGPLSPRTVLYYPGSTVQSGEAVYPGLCIPPTPALDGLCGQSDWEVCVPGYLASPGTLYPLFTGVHLCSTGTPVHVNTVTPGTRVPGYCSSAKPEHQLEP
eukprot:61952-Rhodomonas_salina.2